MSYCCVIDLHDLRHVKDNGYLIEVGAKRDISLCRVIAMHDLRQLEQYEKGYLIEVVVIHVQ